LIHSDQGVHYTSPVFQKLVKKLGLRQSMSRRGNCWDNAPQESFFGHLKDETSIKACTTLDELKKEIKQYMIYYNHYRYQWNLKKMTPVQYEGTEKVQILNLGSGKFELVELSTAFMFYTKDINVCRWYPNDFKSSFSQS
jgi:putative transposase